MSIAYEEIFEAVGHRLQSLNEHVVTIEPETKLVLRDISSRADFLTDSGTITTAAGTKTYSLPSNFKNAIALDVSGEDSLTRIDFKEYLYNLATSEAVSAWDANETYSANDKVTYGGKTWISAQDDNQGNTPQEDEWWDEDTSGRGVPTDYFIFNDLLYLWPVPDGVYTVDIHYSYYHPSDVSSIEFDEQFREAIIEGVMSKLYAGPLARFEGSMDQLALHRQLYESEIDRLMQNRIREPITVRYRDL